MAWHARRPNGLSPPLLNWAAPPPATSQGQAIADTASDAWQWLQDQRAESVRQGLLDPDTGLPTAKGQPVDPHTTPDLNIGIDAAKASGDAYANNATTMRGPDYPDLPVKGLRNPDSITEAAIAHMADNLVWLHDQMAARYGQDTVDRASQWYDGANKIATELADRYGYEPRQVAGMIANLSPQKDWYQNADFGKRITDLMSRPEQPTTPAMSAWAADYAARQQGLADTVGKRAAAAKLQERVARLDGQTLGGIDNPDQRALFVRAYDEAHNPRSYPVLTPEGDTAGLMMRPDGVTPRQISWGSFGELKKALAALDAPDVAATSQTLGGQHKVRSFYNNIVSPNADAGDTTIDTHAIAAAHLRPMGGTHPVVENGLGMRGSSSAATGSKGMYGLYHEAYRPAADRLGLLPRQMQSITWEAVRGLFSLGDKRPGFAGENADIWQAFRNGRMSADEARQAVLDHAGGIDPPTWYQPPPEAPTE